MGKAHPMNLPFDTPLQSVQIAKAMPPIGEADRIQPFGGGEPRIWLGAKCPFGLALPDAHPTASQLYGPRGVWMDAERLIVCDSGNHRVLIWKLPLQQSHQDAMFVLGQPNMTSEGPAAGGREVANGLHLPTGVIVVGNRLLVADAWHHRILVWNAVPEESNTPPDYAIGQSSLEEVQPNRGGEPSLAGMNWPYGMAVVGERFYVADTGNRRVLVWNTFPENDRPADWVLGQQDAISNRENRGGAVRGDSFRWAHDIAGNDQQLWIADAGNHRVLGWNGHPDQDTVADWVLGQQDAQSSGELPYVPQGPRKLRFPYAVASCEDVLAVADTANNRVLFWRIPVAEPTYAAAFDVIGQMDFQGIGENKWKSVELDTLCWPYGLAFYRGWLAVADSGNNRVAIWDCRSMFDRNRFREGPAPCV